AGHYREAAGMKACHPWRVVEFGEYALRAVLKKPAPVGIALIVARDELPEAVMAAGSAGRTCLLCGGVAHAALAAPDERARAKAVRYVGPFAHGLLDDVIHGRSPHRPCAPGSMFVLRMHRRSAVRATATSSTGRAAEGARASLRDARRSRHGRRERAGPG